MKTSLIKFAAASLLALTIASVSRADTITAIMGTGIPDDGWTSNGSINSLQPGSIQLALRARLRYGATLPSSFVPGTGYVYSVENGLYSPTSSLWNIDFSINSDTSGVNPLTAYKYRLFIDTDPTNAVSYNYPNIGLPSGFNIFDPLAVWSDNSLGTNSTAQGAGVEGTNYGDFNIAQNSQNSLWLGIPLIPGDYIIALAAYYPDDNLGSGTDYTPSPIASTAIRIRVLPDGGTTALLLGLGLMAMAAGRRYLGKR